MWKAGTHTITLEACVHAALDEGAVWVHSEKWAWKDTGEANGEEQRRERAETSDSHCGRHAGTRPLTDGLSSPTRCDAACPPWPSIGSFSLHLGWLACPSRFHQSSALSVIPNGLAPPSNSHGCCSEEAALIWLFVCFQLFRAKESCIYLSVWFHLFFFFPFWNLLSFLFAKGTYSYNK